MFEPKKKPKLVFSTSFFPRMMYHRPCDVEMMIAKNSENNNNKAFFVFPFLLSIETRLCDRVGIMVKYVRL